MDDIKCSCGSASVAIFSCSGGSNVGQLSNQLAIDLTEKGVGRMMCAVGIGGEVPGLLRSAEGCDHVIAIDGCPLNCTKKTLERADIGIDRHILITDMGIEKSKDLRIKEDDVSKVIERAAAFLKD